MNKEELTRKIMGGLKESLNESALPKVSSDDNEIYDEADGRTIASIWDDGTVKFKNDLSQEEKALYKASILNNRILCNWFDIREDSFINESLNESKSLDLKTNKDHKAAYNSFVKWYNRWKEKLGREEIRALVKKASNDALGDNLDMINEAYKLPNSIVNTYTGPLPKVDSDDNEIYDEETGETIAIMDIKQYGYARSCCIIKFKPGLSLQDKLNYRDAILKNRTLKRWFNIDKSSFIYYQPELFESLNESGIPGPEDDHLAFDLFLTFQNTRELQDLSRPMVDNLIKRLRKGEELSIDILAASSVVEKYAKATIEEYKRSVYGAPRFINTSTRKNLKRRIAQDLINVAEDDYAFELHDMESNLHK